MNNTKRDTPLQRRHHIIRVADGINFKNSKYPFWGVKRQKNNIMKGFINNQLKSGDILWFCTNKDNGGKAIGMAEYTVFYDRQDEPLFKINTFTNEEQGWVGDGDWDIQIHYKDLYLTEKQNINVILRGSSSIITYDIDNPNQQNVDNLYQHYDGFKSYGEPIKK